MSGYTTHRGYRPGSPGSPGPAAAYTGPARKRTALTDADRARMQPWAIDTPCASCPQLFFDPDNGENAVKRRKREDQAREVCAGCPLRRTCLRHALTMPEPVGVWGGTTAEERAEAAKWAKTQRRPVSPTELVLAAEAAAARAAAKRPALPPEPEPEPATPAAELPPPPAPAAPALTDFDFELLALLAAGRRQVDIAAALKCSRHKVVSRLDRAERLLGVQDRAALTAIACRLIPRPRVETQGLALPGEQAAVLRQLADGQSAADLAVAMGVSVDDMQGLINRMLQTLGARSAAHAVALGFQAGLLDAAVPA